MSDRRPPIADVLPTTFYVDGKERPYQEETFIPLNRGDGLLDNDGTRYRVADRWMSYDHHGRFAEGLHVFLERVEPFSADDTLGNLAPDYFPLPMRCAVARRLEDAARAAEDGPVHSRLPGSTPTRYPRACDPEILRDLGGGVDPPTADSVRRAVGVAWAELSRSPSTASVTPEQRSVLVDSWARALATKDGKADSDDPDDYLTYWRSAEALVSALDMEIQR
jgi:hypothetical protein